MDVECESGLECGVCRVDCRVENGEWSVECKVDWRVVKWSVENEEWRVEWEE